MSSPTFFDALNYEELIADYGRPADYETRFARMSRDELRALQNTRFMKLMAFGWKVPFYQRLWGGQGDQAR